MRKSNPGHIGGRQVLSPLGQPCHHEESNKRQLQQETIAEKLCKASAEGAQELMKANRELPEKVKIDLLHCGEKFATYQC